MKVYCKKTFSYNHKNDAPYRDIKINAFIEGYMYECDTYDNTINVFIVNDKTFAHIRFSKNEKLDSSEPVFSDYFYTTQELRKNKLERINESR